MKKNAKNRKTNTSKPNSKKISKEIRHKDSDENNKRRDGILAGSKQKPVKHATVIKKETASSRRATGNNRSPEKQSKAYLEEQTIELYQLIVEQEHDTPKRPNTVRRTNSKPNDLSVRNASKSIKSKNRKSKKVQQSVDIHNEGEGASNEAFTAKRIDGNSNKENKEFTEQELKSFQKELNALIPFTKKDLNYIKYLRGLRTRLNAKIKPLREYIDGLHKQENTDKKVFYKGEPRTIKYILKDKIKEIVALNKDYQETGRQLDYYYGIKVKKDPEFRDLKSEPFQKGYLRLALCMHFQMKKVFDYLRAEHIFNEVSHKFNMYDDMNIETQSDKILESLNETETKMESKNVFYLQIDLANNSCYGFIDDKPTRTKDTTLLYDKSYFTKKVEKVKQEPQPRKIKLKDKEDI